MAVPNKYKSRLTPMVSMMLILYADELKERFGNLIPAKYTSAFLQTGKWEIHCIVKNLTKSQSLSYERIIKNRRRKGKGKTPLDKRLYLMNELGLDIDFLEKTEEYFPP